MINNIFNQAYLDKYRDKFVLDKKKKDIIKNYLKKIEENDFLRERGNYVYFYDKILNNLLGYTIDENLGEDVPTDTGSGFSEFVVMQDNKKYMVVELKKQNIGLDVPQTSRADRKTPVEQAFKYAEDNDDVDWILVSNFKEFRLYSWEKKKNNYISFNFEDLLDEKFFSYFMLAFSLKSHEDGLINILMETISVDREFESNFYNLYHQTRLFLINELNINGFDDSTAIHYAQIILNRYIFICFAEDTGIIPPETTKNTILNTLSSGRFGRGNVWKALNDLFIDLNEGSSDGKIGEFNGGLFAENLDDNGIYIRDEIDDGDFAQIPREWDFRDYEEGVNDLFNRISRLYREHIIKKLNPIFKNLLIIASFNFHSQVDVNILGHIFENSIDDLEKLYEDIQDASIRRTGGIYYTHEYITDFICRNTIIPYLSKSGTSYTIDDLVAEYMPSELNILDEKLENIKILDPACGSGAFLNKATDIVVEIHKAIHKENLKVDYSLDSHFNYYNKRKEVLQRNIYGVDINEESVEITKLSLFLKIAQKEDPHLPNIRNIKCGNSLLEDDSTSKPFDWGSKFKSVFDEGKFDIIIGNPPYVAWYEIEERKAFESGKFLDLEYHCRPKHKDSQPNLYHFFIVRSLNLLKNKGYLSFIIPQEWLSSDNSEFRDYYLNNSGNVDVFNFHPEFRVFKTESEEIGTNSLIIRFKNNNENNLNLAQLKELQEHVVEFFLKRYTIKDIFNKNIDKYDLSIKKVDKNSYFGLRWEIYSPIIERLLLKFNNNHIPLSNGEYFKVKGGFQPNVELSKKYLVEKEELNILTDYEKNNVFPCIYDASNIKKYYLIENNLYWIILNGLFLEETDFKEKCPNLYNLLTERLDITRNKWWEFPNVRNLDIFRIANEKILTPRTASINSFYLDFDRHVFKGTNSLIFSEKLDTKFVIGILNSSLANYWYREYGYGYHGGETKKYEPAKIKDYMIPIYRANESDQTYIIKRVTKLIECINKKHELIFKFINWVRYKLRTHNLSKGLINFYRINYDLFLEELTNYRNDFDEDELETITNKFKIYKSKVQKINSIISGLNEEIDNKVFDLYSITNEEKLIIKNS